MAKIFLVEDDAYFRDALALILEHNKSFHTLEIIAETLEEALEAVGKLAEMGITIAVVDANLEWGEGSGDDGRRVAEAINKLDLGIKIIVWSRSYYNWGHAYARKGPLKEDYQKLLASIDSFAQDS